MKNVALSKTYPSLGWNGYLNKKAEYKIDSEII